MAAPVRPHFHGECDVAAMVYGRLDDPDTVLHGFIRRQIERGYDALGVVQRRLALPLGGVTDFLMVPDEDGSGRKAAVAACGTALQGIGVRLTQALARRPNVLVLNRYGSLEAAGGGLLDVLAAAIDRDIPVVIAVPEALFASWLDMTEGLAVKLGPHGPSLDAWWNALGRAPADASPQTFCERFK